MIRIIIADDHEIVLNGIRALFEQEGDILIAGQASDGQAALDLVEKHRPDVLVIDLMMPRMSGLQVAQRIREKNWNIQIVVLSMYYDRGLVRQALALGVRGYVLKTSASQSLVKAVRAAAARETYLNGALGQVEEEIREKKSVESAEGDILASLSPREREILQLTGQGLSIAEIAAQLVVSQKTVEKHRASLMQKLEVPNAAGLVRMAIRLGLVKADRDG